MKYLILVFTTLMIGFQAQASVSADEFVEKFAAAMNRRLVFTNQDRIAANKRPYCTGLSQEQVNLIAQAVALNPEQTAERFLDVLSPELKCYPIFLPPLKREGWGVVLNTKAYWMDIELIRATLADLGLNSRELRAQKILDSLNP